jgi:hypothetical protein
MIDAVWIVRPGDHNEELRYSIRSVETNLPVRSVSVAGHRPAWLNCHHIYNGQREAPVINALDNLKAALVCTPLTERIAVFNDDFFCMGPLERIPLLHRGPLAMVTTIARIERGDTSVRTIALQDTLDILRRIGVPSPFCFDLHTPIVVDRAELAETLDIIAAYTAGWDAERRARILWKTVHANLWNTRSMYSPDVKVRGLEPVDPWPSPFLSTVDLSFHYGAVGNHIRTQFPTPSRYEE